MRHSLLLLLVLLVAVIQGCSPVEVLNAFVPNDTYHGVRDVAYGENARQKLDIYKPVGNAGKQGRDVVVFIHGGSWQFGGKDEYVFAGEAFASRGYVTVIPNYRLAPEVMYPAFVDDTARAVSWVKKHIAEYGGNPKRIFLVGHSAGAYNVMMSFALKQIKPQEIAGVVGLAGPYDFLPLTDPKLQKIFAVPKLEVTQPLSYAKQKFPPMLLMTGDNDTDVYPKNTRNFAAALQKSGNRVETVYLHDVSHVRIMSALASPIESEEVLTPLFEFLGRSR